MGGRPQFPPAEKDSSIVARLRSAGAVIVGHTNVPERCLWPFSETVTYGAARNPWHLDYTPGGSSGGSAASVAAGIVGVATGSDGGGSIRIPASACGVFGLKTTRGLVALDREGWHGLSVLGPIGRRVADAAAMLDVIADVRAALGDGPASTYRAAADADPGKLRIALSWRAPLGRPPMEAQRKQAVLETAERLRGLGHEVVEADPALGFRPSAQFMVRYIRGASDDVAELPHQEWLEDRTRKIAWIGRRIPDSMLNKMLAAEAELDSVMRAFFGGFDVLLQPTWTGRPHRVGRFHGRGLAHTWAVESMAIPYFPTWNVLGYPSAAVPVGRDSEGVPMGVQLIGGPFTERLLLSLAAQYERAHPWTVDRPAL
jgi:amidase